jgi:hypothetical protein
MEKVKMENKNNRDSMSTANCHRLPVVTHALFSAWMLSFLFEGRTLYLLADIYKINPKNMVFSGIAALFVGLLLCGLFIKTRKAAKRLFLSSYLFFIAISAVFSSRRHHNG